jgi:hypothetical protein
MFLRLASVAAVAAGLVILSGCGPATLNFSKAYKMEPGRAEGPIFDKQSKPQKLTINFTSSDGEVTVLLFKSEDVTELNIFDLDPKKALGFKSGAGETFVVDVPENTETRIVIRDAKKATNVDLKVTNQ